MNSESQFETLIDVETVVKQIQEGETWKQLGKRYDCHPDELKRWFKKKGITRIKVLTELRHKRKESQPHVPTFDELKNDTIAGLTVKQVAEKYGVSYTGAYKWYKRYNLGVNKTTTKAPPVVEILDMMKHFSQKDAAKLYNVTTKTFQGWQFHYGLIDRPWKRKARIPEEVRDYALQQYFLGLWDEEDIAEEYGLPHHTVFADVKEYGFTEDMLQMMPGRDELLKDSKKMNLAQLAEYYGTTQTQVAKWFDTLSITYKGEKQNV